MLKILKYVENIKYYYYIKYVARSFNMILQQESNG